MSGQFAIEVGGGGLLVPAAVSLAVLLVGRLGRLGRRLLPAGVAARSAAALAFVGGVLAGYALLPTSPPWWPARHWHWLPWLAVAAGAVGPLGIAGGVSRGVRRVLHVLLAVGAAWLLVPTWAGLWPPRGVLIAALAAYLFLLIELMQVLASRAPRRWLLAALCLAAAASAAAIAANVSVTYGQVALSAAGALLGICAGSWRRGDRSATAGEGAGEPAAGETPGLIPAYVIFTAGAAFVGGIDPQPPQFAFLLIPALPLVLLGLGTLQTCHVFQRTVIVRHGGDEHDPREIT